MTYKIVSNADLVPKVLDTLTPYCDVKRWYNDEPNDPAVLQEAEGFFVYGHPHITGEVMNSMPNCRVISNFGVGVDHIDLEAAKARGIPVGNTPGFVDGATADMTFTLLMAAARNVVIGHQYAIGPDFLHYNPDLHHGQEIYGSTLGIIGMGRIGKEVARRASGFDMKVLYHNRNRDLEAEAALNVSYATLPELLKEADFVTLNMPLTPETRGMIGAAELAQMKSSAILINLARGGVVQHDALVDALRNKTIWAAALDVTEPEPLPRDNPLLTLENVIIAPHLGSATLRTRKAMVQRTTDNLLAGLRGEALLSRVA
ncbi:MAG: D-glycerate dehydrogenase [Chloroflexota bacterium]